MRGSAHLGLSFLLACGYWIGTAHAEPHAANVPAASERAQGGASAGLPAGEAPAPFGPRLAWVDTLPAPDPLTLPATAATDAAGSTPVFGALIDRFSGWIGNGDEPQLKRPFVVPTNDKVDAVTQYFHTRRRRILEQGYRRSGRYVPMIQKVFAEAGIPEELAYLAAVESNYNPKARSRSRAVGLWQFMASTGRTFGLRVNLPWYDERLDPVYSTRAAARLLAYLHDTYGSWELALAAYNAGEARVNRAIRRSRQPEGEEDFWTLHRLPRETKGYVPSFFALARIYHDPKRYGLAELEQELPLELEAVKIEVATTLADLAQRIAVPVEDLRRLNPAWKRGVIPPVVDLPVLLHVPTGLGPKLAASLAKQPPTPVAWRVHTAGPGDTLARIAREYGVTLSEVKGLNPRQAKRLAVGQPVTLPLSADAPSVPAELLAAAANPEFPDHGTRTVHRVRSGESLWIIARRYGVATSDLKRWNDLDSNRLLPDLDLVVFLPQ